MSFEDAWKNAANELIEPPAGTYKVRIGPSSNAFTSKAGDDYAKIALEITDGDLRGATFEHFMGFKNEVGARINREALLAYGLQGSDEIRSIEDLDDAISKLTGRTSEVSVAYKDGYMQVRVSGSRAAEGTAESDIPTNPTNGTTDQKPAADFADAAARSQSTSDEDVPF